MRIADIAKGRVEYLFEGEGPAVLIVHGGHGSCRGEYGQQHLVRAGFSVLTPTRPGYKGTPIDSGTTAEATADLFAALLDTLGIETVCVVGNSAGGPTAIEFAARHQGRTKRLVLEAAVTKPWFHRLTVQYYGSKFIFSPKRQQRFWRNLRAKLEQDEHKTLKGTMKRFTRLPATEVLEHLTPTDIEALKIAMVTGNDSGIGFVYDVDHRAPDIERISCPTLIIHSKNDGSVPFAHAEYARAKIAGAELFEAQTDSHFLYIGPGSQEVLERRAAFFHSPDAAKGVALS